MLPTARLRVSRSGDVFFGLRNGEGGRAGPAYREGAPGLVDPGLLPAGAGPLVATDDGPGASLVEGAAAIAFDDDVVKDGRDPLFLCPQGGNAGGAKVVPSVRGTLLERGTASS